MKDGKWIKYVISLIVGISFVAMYIIGYYIASKWDAKVVNEGKSDYIESDANEKIVKNKAKYILEVYNKKNGEYTYEEKNIPSEFVGLTLDEVISFINENRDFFENETEILDSVMLVSFATDRLVIRKSIEDYVEMETVKEPKEEMPKYYIVIIEGRVVIYKNDLETIYMETGILECELSDEIARELRNGKGVYSISELYRFLESYTS